MNVKNSGANRSGYRCLKVIAERHKLVTDTDYINKLTNKRVPAEPTKIQVGTASHAPKRS